MEIDSVSIDTNAYAAFKKGEKKAVKVIEIAMLCLSVLLLSENCFPVLFLAARKSETEMN